MPKRKMKPIEFLLLACGVVAFLLFNPAPPPQKKLVAAKEALKPVTASTTDVKAKSIPLVPQHDPIKGSLFTSWEGDPCRVVSVEHDYHPRGYEAGTELKHTVLTCINKASKHYTLKNVGVYQKGKLIAWSRNKIEDGHCRPLFAKITAVKDIPNIKVLFALFSCNKDGKVVWDEVKSLAKDGKPVLTKSMLRDPAALKIKKETK